MTTYKYKGQSLSGARVSGVVRAYDEFEAVAKLRDTCAFITKIEPVKERGNALDKPIGFRLKDKELALLCSQFSIILTSGLSVMRCVEMVASQTRNKYTRRMLEKVAEEVGAGYSLAQSFESNAPYLPATFIETVRAGEESGTLALCFDRLHRYYERTARTRAKIISTMTYPAMVIVVAIIVFIIIIAVAVPAFTDAFADLGEGELPGVTKALMAVSGFFNRWWWLLLLIGAALVIAYLAFKRTERGKLVLASYAIERAPLRRLRSMSAAGRFANTMSTMLTAGLGVPRALDVTSQVVGNYLFSLGVRKVKENVERGRGIAESMAGVLPQDAHRDGGRGRARGLAAADARRHRQLLRQRGRNAEHAAAQRARAGHHHRARGHRGRAAAGGVPADVQYVRQHLIRYHFRATTPRGTI